MLETGNQHHGPIGMIGVGDLTYTIGLFRLMSGEKRNLPIVHSGSIAMLPKDEKIPVRGNENETVFVEGHLIETHSLDGLSGSPVFVRPTAAISIVLSGFSPDTGGMSDEARAALSGFVARGDLRVLGLWQGAWDAPPDDVLGIQSGRPFRASVGVGIVVPAQRIIETLNLPEIVEMKNQVKRQIEEMDSQRAASTESIDIVKPQKQELFISDADNPSHKEDFTSLLNVAAKKKPQDD